MRINHAPVTSCEVRWFLESGLAEQDALRRWFQAARPWRAATNAIFLDAEGYRASPSRTDVHLVIPGATDMGITWRQGMLQVKGRVNTGRMETFCGRFEGQLEPWVAWSYDDLSAFYQNVFSTPPRGVVTVPVRQSRMLRTVRLDPETNVAEEVRPGAIVDRGMTVELVDLEVNGVQFCSVRFKAFPDDARMPARVVREVSACLESLEHVTLVARNSRSLPAWLGMIAGCNARPVPVASRRFGLAVAL